MATIRAYGKEFEEGEVIATSDAGCNLVVMGGAKLGTLPDLLVSIQDPDGSFPCKEPVALQRLLKFSGSDGWIFIEK
jgi:hypothetical protein